jgi:ferredoxin
MAYKISDECISCGACESECDVNKAITEGPKVYVIDAAKCTECVGNTAKPKCVEVCPIEKCITLDPVHKETKDQLLAKWKKLHPGKTPKA